MQNIISNWLPNLETLNIRNSSLTDAGLQILSSLNLLKNLNLVGCDQITDAGIQSLESLTSLQSLILCHCYKITNIAIQSLSSLTSLQNLDLAGCGLDDEGLQTLESLTKLQILDLSYCNQITDLGLQNLRELPLNKLNLLDCSSLGRQELIKYFTSRDQLIEAGICIAKEREEKKEVYSSNVINSSGNDGREIPRPYPHNVTVANPTFYFKFLRCFIFWLLVYVFIHCVAKK